MDDERENVRRLIDAGVIPGPLPEPYNKVVESLDGSEIEALITVKQRLDEANASIGGPGNIGFIGMVVPV